MSTKVKVLIIEDNPGDVRLIKEGLPPSSSCSFDIACADRLSEGLERLTEAHPDIVLLDLSLPDSTGLETFDRLQERAGHTPVVVLTGYNDEETAIMAMQHGAQDYLVKGEQNGSALARSIRYAIERQRTLAQLHTTSLTDELTGLYNRRGFLNLAGHQLKIADRTKKPLLLFFVDLDDMKWINDSFGHPQGDMALIETAEALRITFRQSDVIGRMGGDEFAVLALDVSLADVDIITHRLQRNIAEQNQNNGGLFDLSLSMGIAQYDDDRRCSLDDLLSIADTLMYEQKRSKQRV